MPVIIESAVLSQEWNTLQNNYEQYEKSALLIKLTAVVLCAIGVVLGIDTFVVAMIVLVLWVQEGIFRTYQSRLGDRLMRVEKLLAGDEQSEGAAFQLHTEWHANRPGVAGLIAQYAANTLKPTIAFPYAIPFVIALYYAMSAP
jgi:flagellar biosynthesis component FlhA